jgi:hypothetical protein
MDNRQIQFYSWVMDEHRKRLQRQSQQAALLNHETDSNRGLKRHVLSPLAIAAIIVTVAVLAGAQFMG